MKIYHTVIENLDDKQVEQLILLSRALDREMSKIKDVSVSLSSLSLKVTQNDIKEFREWFDPSKHIILAEQDDVIAGYSIYELCDETYNLRGLSTTTAIKQLHASELYVSENFRRQHLATQILDEVRASAKPIAKKMRISSMILGTPVQNYKAQKFYEKYGMKATWLIAWQESPGGKIPRDERELSVDFNHYTELTTEAALSKIKTAISEYYGKQLRMLNSGLTDQDIYNFLKSLLECSSKEIKVKVYEIPLVDNSAYVVVKYLNSKNFQIVRDILCPPTERVVVFKDIFDHIKGMHVLFFPGLEGASKEATLKEWSKIKLMPTINYFYTMKI